MGFSRIILPKQSDKKRGRGKKFTNTRQSINFTGIDCIEAEDLKDAIENGLVSRIPKKRPKKKKIKSQGMDSYEIQKNDLIIDDDDDDDDDDYEWNF